jgi:hypothetical protein
MAYLRLACLVARLSRRRAGQDEPRRGQAFRRGRPSIAIAADYYPPRPGRTVALPVQASPNPTEPGRSARSPPCRDESCTVAERGAQKGCENAGALWRPGEMDGVYFRMAHHVATCLAAPGASPVRARALIPMRVPGVSTPGRFRPRQPRSSTSLMGRKTDPLGAPGFVDGLAKAEPATRETQCQVYLAAN